MYVCICVGKTCNSIYNKTMHPKKGKAEKIWRKFQGSLKEVSKEVLQNFHKTSMQFCFCRATKFAECDNLGFVDFGKICRIRQINFQGR